VAIALAARLDPDRDAVRLDVSGIGSTARSLTIARTGPSGESAGVRGVAPASISGSATTYVARDYEAPFGVALTYTATTRDAGGAVLSTATTTFTLASDASDDPWLVDLARPANSQQVIVESLQSLEYESAAGVHRVLERRAPVLTTAPAWTPRTELRFLTSDKLERDRARASLGTGVPVLLRTDPGQGVGNLYLGVTGFTEERPARIAQFWTRRFIVQGVQVDRPDPSIYVPAPPMTYSVVKSTYATYATLTAAVPTYDELANAYPPGAVAPFPPWPPEDV
jgi:hypothetical protein